MPRLDAPGPANWNAQQLAVIEAAGTARIVVEAGPGTGKTAVACARVAHLLKEDVPATSIWFVSFTRTAVREIRNRIGTLTSAFAEAHGVRISTIDSQAWQLRHGFGPAGANVFAGFELGIANTIALLHHPPAELKQELETIRHLIVDEAQDVVGERCELLQLFIARLPADAGVTVFSDPAQAIYGFTEDDTAAAAGPTLPEILKAGAPVNYSLHRLDEVIRTDNYGLRHIFANPRLRVLHEPSLSIEQLTSELEAHCTGGIPIGLANAGLAGRGDVLVLYRRRADVLRSAAFLADSGTTPFRLRMSGLPRCITPWLAGVFWDWTSHTMTKTELQARLRDRAPLLLDGPHPDLAWESLRRTAGESNTRIDVVALRGVLSRTHAPPEFESADCGHAGPVLGTIHASKGREANEVFLYIYKAIENTVDLSEERRVIFVGATRARSSLKIGRLHSARYSATKSGRQYSTLRGAKTFQVEVGMQPDVDENMLVAQAAHATPGDAEDVQAYAAGLDGVPVRARLKNERLAIKDYAWILRIADAGPRLAQLTANFNQDLWEIEDRTRQHRGGLRMRPPYVLNNIFLLGSRSIVRARGDACLPQMHEPWASSGFWLAPVIFAFSLGWLQNYRHG